MDHSPRKEAEDDPDEDDNDNDDDQEEKHSKKDLENAVYGTQPTDDNPSPLPRGLNGVLEEMVKCVLMMEAWCPGMLQAFDKDGDQYATQHHNQNKHDFSIRRGNNMWPVDADGNPIEGDADHIYKFTHMKRY